MGSILRVGIPIVMISILLTSCYTASKYSGDGRLVDNGIFAASDRYILDLKEIDLRSDGSRQYRMSNLPIEIFAVGIRIDFEYMDGFELAEMQQVDPMVLLELSLNGSDQIIFRKKSNLREWTWSQSLNESEVFIYGRDMELTYFTPIEEASYLMTLTVINPDLGGLQYVAYLEARSGGWK